MTVPSNPENTYTSQPADRIYSVLFFTYICAPPIFKILPVNIRYFTIVSPCVSLISSHVQKQCINRLINLLLHLPEKFVWYGSMKQCFITDRHPYEVHAEKQINKYFHFTLICFKPETVQCRRIKQQYKGDKKIGKSVNNIHSENHQTANRCKQSRIQKKTFVKRKLSESFGQFSFLARIPSFPA